MSINKKTGMGTVKFSSRNKQDDLFIRISNAIWPYVVGVLATYGFMDILLRANGM